MGYREAGTWNGLVRYECEDCAFDAVDEDRIKAHVSRHAVTAARPTGLVGPDGEPVVVEEAVPIQPEEDAVHE